MEGVGNERARWRGPSAGGALRGGVAGGASGRAACRPRQGAGLPAGQVG